jgi:type I restriction enzyme S subunit
MTGKNHSIKTARIKDVAELDPETLGESTAPGFTFKYIDLSLVKGGRVGEHVESMTFAAAPGRARKLVKEGDILLGMVRPYLKPFAKVQRVFDGHVASTGFAVIRAKSDVTDPEYLYQTIWSDGVSKQIHQMVTGSNYPALSVGDVKDLKVPLPPLAEQRKIAEILRTWDEAIETAEAELKAKQERKRGMMQKLLSPGRQIKRKAGNSFNESVRHFELTNGWSWMFIHEVAKLSFSSVDKKSVEGEKSVRLCNYMDVFYNRRIREGMPFMKSTASDSDIKKFTLNQGDVVLTKDSETPEEIAFAAVIDEQIDNLVCGYHLAVLRPDKAKVTGEYLMSAINFHPNHHQFVRLANGATRFGLGIDSLNNAVIPIPPLEEQRKIAEILQNADAGIEVINNRIEALRTQKRGLMQKLLTGEVRVAA